MLLLYFGKVVLDTTKVQIFKQITTSVMRGCVVILLFQIPQRYRFSSKSQPRLIPKILVTVVLDTTKVQIFKQITTVPVRPIRVVVLFQIPQRYRFSSKSQPNFSLKYDAPCCFRYHKGTDFQANHNYVLVPFFKELLFQIPQRYRFSSKSQLVTSMKLSNMVVLDTTKVQIFKQITTVTVFLVYISQLFQIPQRYRFSSKSQR